MPARTFQRAAFRSVLERIIVVMTERSMFPSQVGQTSEVMVGIWNESTVEDSLIAAELRARGIRVESYPEPDKLAKQFKYAAAIEVPFVVIIGEAEKEKDEVAIKNMRTGEQQSLPRNEVAELILLEREGGRHETRAKPTFRTANFPNRNH